MKRFLERSFPPGYWYKAELKITLITLVDMALISLFGFLNAYSSARQSLFMQMGTDLILDESRTMPDFTALLGNKLNLVLIPAALIFVIAIVLHYAYHQSGSRSIYLMRRLPDRFELHRRCLLIPLITVLTFILVAALLFFIYYAIYMNFTPSVCLTPNQWEKIKLWRGFQ